MECWSNGICGRNKNHRYARNDSIDQFSFRHYLVLDRKRLFSRSKNRNPKHEIRNNDRNKNAPMTKTTDFQCISFGHFVIRYSNLFRISVFGFCLNMTFRSGTI